jgi:hypothetical protein
MGILNEVKPGVIFGDDLQKYGRAKQAINEHYNTAHTLCMLDN